MKNKEKPIRIDVGLTGGVELIDVDAFFQQKKVKDTIERMSKIDIVGKTLSGNPTPRKLSKNSK